MSSAELYEYQVSGIRSVMTDHTCFDRIKELLSHLGYKHIQSKRNILIIVEELTENVKRCFNKQTYPWKTIQIITNITQSYVEKFDMVAFFSDTSEYEEFYLEDMINAFKYTNCDYITKDAWYEGINLHKGIEHDYVNHYSSKYRTVFWRNSFSYEFLINMSDSGDLQNGYSIDHFNYNEKKLHHLIILMIIKYQLLFLYTIMGGISIVSALQVLDGVPYLKIWKLF